MAAEDKPIIAVIGADDYNMGLIEAIPGYEDYEILPVLSWEDMQPPHGRIDFEDLYQRARNIIDDHPGDPVAVVGHLDFPVTSIVSLLTKHYGLTGASPEAVAKCEHKYWMRVEQKEALPDRTPDVRAVNPFDPDGAKKDALPYPFWLKPVKGHSSVLGFMIEDEGDLDDALHECRQKIHLIGEPFNKFLSRLEDRGVAETVDGNFAIAEALISASRQFTLEGYVYQGETVIYGAVDSIRGGEHQSSFSRYQYPGDIPEDVIEQGRKIAHDFLSHIGYDNAPFNVEYFWNPEDRTLNLLEINPRISKSHSPLFRMVDGCCHQKVAIDLALGREPKMPKGEGKDDVAAKFMFRSFEADGIVKRVPSDQEIGDLKRILPDIDTNILVEKDVQLSTLFFQESYSYELADVFLGGNSVQMIEDSYHRCLDSLPIYIKPLPEEA